MRKEFVISLFLMTILCGSCETAVGNLPVIHPEDAPEISDISPYVKSIEEIPLSDASDGAFASIQKVIVLPSGGKGYHIRPLEGEDILYRVNGDSLEQVMKVSFGKEQAPQKSLLNNGRYDIPSYIMSQYFKMPMDFQFTDKHILFTAVGPEGVMHYYLYDNEFSPLGFWKEPDGCMSPVKIASSDSESFYILLNNPSYWREVISSCPLSGDNPTLLKVTFN